MEQESQNSFYYYHNPERNPHLKIHRGSCGNCKNGTGKHTDVSKGLNSVWTGPFHSLEWAETYIEKNIRKDYETSYCEVCNPKG